MLILAYALYTVIHDTFASHGQMNTVIFLLSECIFLGCIGTVALWYARMIFTSAKMFETVALRSSQNAVSHSDFETLVRAYAFHPSQQNAELLRAALDRGEMPSNDLLRATAQEFRRG